MNCLRSKSKFTRPYIWRLMSFRRLTGVEIVGAPVALTEIHLCSQSRFCGQMNQRLYNTAYPAVLLRQVGSEMTHFSSLKTDCAMSKSLYTRHHAIDAPSAVATMTWVSGL